MKIDNVEISGLGFAKACAGLPKGKFEEPKCLPSLVNAKIGSGHDCALKGICIHMKITASQTWWLQMGRYHFSDIISSQSKMHSILYMEPSFHPTTDRYVQKAFLDTVESLRMTVEEYPETVNQAVESCAMSAPMGMELCAGIITNMLQLKTIKKQRQYHKLSEWRTFCDFIDGLWVDCRLGDR